jgi:hypothetical protein
MLLNLIKLVNDFFFYKKKNALIHFLFKTTPFHLNFFLIDPLKCERELFDIQLKLKGVDLKQLEKEYKQVICD